MIPVVQWHVGGWRAAVRSRIAQLRNWRVGRQPTRRERCDVTDLPDRFLRDIGLEKMTGEERTVSFRRRRY
ncbi:MAG: hypothetical protein ABJN26_15125 [Stappiaceae bacterium]